ncbi:MAG TPA: helix-turn-helix domain-containing protein [Pseudomonadales bacterium]|nr:helix-turn-helix domain-containing protein [Pseudomonadales bacterium]
MKQHERREATIAAILEAARAAFGKRGFAATTIESIADECGIAKGAVYHHFASKEALFTAVLEAVQVDVANAPIPPSAARLTDPLDQIAAGVLRYLIATSEPEVRKILLIDGPAVVGWQKWREIDARIFAAAAKPAIARALGLASAAQVDAVVHLIMGSVTEAALVCAASPRPKVQARAFVTELRAMLEGVRAQHRT